jgi:FixJ family two-component response regulator
MLPIKLLVVDDEQGIREAIRRALRTFTVRLSYFDEEYGFDIDTAESAEEGLAKVRTNDFQIILLDNQLPGMTGLDFLKILHDSGSEVVPIMITAYASIETAITATKRGAFDFVTKPFTPQELRDALVKAVKHLVLSSSARKFAEEKKRIRFQVLSTLNQEMQTPLALLKGFLRQIDQNALGVVAAENGEPVRNAFLQVKDMENLLDDLLTMAQIESGDGSRQIAPLRLDQLVQEVLTSFENELGGRQLILEKRLNPVELPADRSEMALIVRNLISQGIRYHPQGGRVVISLSAKSTQAVFSVVETGSVFPAPLFEAQRNEGPTVQREVSGAVSPTGVGLSTVKIILARYNGLLTGTTEKGGSRSFFVTLPIP